MEMCFHGNQLSWRIKHPLISLWSKYCSPTFIRLSTMLAPVIPSLDEIYCISLDRELSYDFVQILVMLSFIHHYFFHLLINCFIHSFIHSNIHSYSLFSIQYPRSLESLKTSNVFRQQYLWLTNVVMYSEFKSDWYHYCA